MHMNSPWPSPGLHTSASTVLNLLTHANSVWWLLSPMYRNMETLEGTCYMLGDMEQKDLPLLLLPLDFIMCSL